MISKRRLNMTVDRLLSSVGMRTFVKYYYNFKNQSRSYCIANFEENFTDKAKSSKTGHAQSIFKNNMEKDALLKIIHSSRVDDTTKLKATIILKNEFGC